MGTGSRGALPPHSIPEQEPVRVREIVTDAALWALVALGLCFPIVLWRTEQDFAHRMVLNARPLLVAVIVAGVFLGRIAWRLFRHPRQAKPLTFPQLDVSDGHKRWLPRLGLGLLLMFPFLALALAGPAGAVKWVDNFG